MDIVMKNKIVDTQDEFDITTNVVEDIFKLINKYINKHGDLALLCGSEWLFQNDDGQVDALELVGNILDKMSILTEIEDEDEI